MRSDEIEELFPDIKISKTFKWKPKTSIIDGLKKLLNFMLKPTSSKHYYELS